MKGSRNRRVGMVLVLVAFATALGSISVASAGATTHRAALSGRLSTMIVPAPLPSRQARHQAATDRRDPFVRSAAPKPALGASVPSGTWSPLGPAAIGPAALQFGGNYGTPNAGRVETPVTIPSGTHSGRLVIGTAGGGIFTSDDGGTTWVPRTDQAASLAIKGIAIDPSNPNHLIAGTGEAENCGDCYYGSGILSSTDGGTTWTLQNPGNIFFGDSTSQVAIDPSNSNHMFAATTGGLFVTSNGGATWAHPTDPSFSANVDGIATAVVINPTTPTIVYVASTDGNTAVKVAKSIDGGVTWAPAQTGIPAALTTGGFAPLISLAIAASSPATLYASVGSTGPVAVYKTTSAGATWTALTGTPDFTGQGYAYGGGTADQGYYDNVLAVDPTNPNHVLAGGIAAIESTDGGAIWTNTNGGNFSGATNHDHPDHHGLAFAANGSVLVADDGGIYRYTPSGTTAPGTFTDLNGNLNDAQFYAGFNEVGGTVLAGMQDNASAETSSATIAPWTALPGGDGGASEITPNDPAERFITDGNEGISITTNSFGNLNNITPSYGNSLFTVPFTLAPNTATPSSPTVYFGADGVYRTTNPTAPSPTWTKVATSGSGLVSAFAVSPTNPNVVYAGYNNGTIQVSVNGGTTWTALPSEPFTDTFITGISVDPTNQQAITVSVSYNNTRYAPGFAHVAQFSYTSSIAAGSWTDITGSLPTFAAVTHVVYDNGALVAATDMGVYGTSTPNGASTTWSVVGTGMPNVQVQDLYLDPATNNLYAITHGRGAWKLPGIAPVAPVIISQVRPGAAGNDFVELYNRSASTVSLSGWTLNFETTGSTTGIAATLPGGASIAPNGYYLLADGAYSLTSYAAADAPLTPFANTDSIALENTQFVVEDAVAFGSESMFTEGSPVGTWPGSGEYAFVRRLASSAGGDVGPPLDTGNNATDFALVRPENQPVAGSLLTAIEGSPGPHDTASPTNDNPNIAVSLLCGTNTTADPNFSVVTGGPVVGGAATRTLYLRRTITNVSGSPITSLRFRISNITTDSTPAPPAGQAILRAVSSSATTVTGTSTGCTSTFPLTPMTLDSPASANTDGGGLNASLSVPSVSAGTPLAGGASINIAFELGVVGAGNYRFYFNTETK